MWAREPLRKAVAPFVFAVGMVMTIGACQTAISGAELKLGDCADNTNSVDANGDQVASYAVVDCAQEHDNEVFSIFDYPGATSAFPGYEAIGEVEQRQCESDFEEYVGITWALSSYTISYAGPTEGSWASGGHTISCLLSNAAGEKVTGSAEGSGQ